MSIDDKIDDVIVLHMYGGDLVGQSEASHALKKLFASEISKLAPLRIEDYRAVGFRLKTLLDKYDHLTPAQHKGVLYEALYLLAFKE